ncbi:helix-turn-helix domain-containing protein [Sinorhizobium alkalisoli]|uniref:helix-turn-helix domain-containing protein n=1 Tax=Sinorhizobium alkalisoli TaxID=1752398 RepID=UPI00124CA898|nr:helix-turn-helix transcriptional regulator [Sinorhizobium alkalisoli]QFI69817.1 putative transcriptional regulator protein [Sinorhizobium alkalisoli]
MSISPTLGEEQVPILLASDIAARVRAAREAVGYSIEDLAVTCGLTSIEISDIESGGDSDPVKLKRVATALQVPISHLLPGEV